MSDKDAEAFEFYDNPDNREPAPSTRGQPKAVSGQPSQAARQGNIMNEIDDARLLRDNAIEGRDDLPMAHVILAQLQRAERALQAAERWHDTICSCGAFSEHVDEHRASHTADERTETPWGPDHPSYDEMGQ